jgi:hypothetical protein
VSVSPADANQLSSGATSATSALTFTFASGTQVTLTYPSQNGLHLFDGITGVTCSSTTVGTSNGSCSFAVNANTSVSVNYGYNLTVNSTNPASGVSVTASSSNVSGIVTPIVTPNQLGAIPSGGTILLTAPATASGNTFGSWTGCTTISGAQCSVTVNSDTTVSASYTTPPPNYTLTVDSTNPSTGVAITASPADVNAKTSGNTPLTLTYVAGTAVKLTAPTAIGTTATFGSWTGGCNTASSVTCNVTLTANTTVTAGYNPVLVNISPAAPSLTIGATQQFTATVTDPKTTNQAVTWSISGPTGWTGGLGTITNATGSSTANGLYTTPYPAPPSVTITATSVGDSAAIGTTTLTFASPAAGTGPALSVDAGNEIRSISPYIYGTNNYQLTAATLKKSGATLDRFGGDGSQRYNYLIDATSSAADYFFENQTGNTGVEATGAVNTQIASDAAAAAKTMVTVDVLGWVAKDTTSCSFPVATYPNQYAVDPYRPCGDGEYANQSNITGNDPTKTSIAVTPAWTNGWVQYLTNKFGNSASGGVFIYELDNEPAWWDGVHRDVHPIASTYDEVTNNGIAVAKAVKSADPTAAVSGPVIDYWWNYFYSKKDVEAGWGKGPCYSPWSNPQDRQAHGGVPMVEYYLQQMQSASTTYGARLLDYLDLHTYYAGSYQGVSVAFTTPNNVGMPSDAAFDDTGKQQARLNSTRVFWDPTYTDPNEPQPNYPTDSGYTTSCNTPLLAPQIIPMMQKWVANDYPGTKTAITEYNWGGQEIINGAIAQADLLGIFGQQGLDLATLWGPPDPVTQVPGLVAFEAFRNYDGAGAQFGDKALASTSTNQGQLAVYGAKRTSDGAVTIIVLNKTYGDLSSTLSLPNLTATGPAKVYLYNNANIAGIVTQPSLTITPPGGGTTTNTLTTTFPAQSIMILIIPTT